MGFIICNPISNWTKGSGQCRWIRERTFSINSHWWNGTELVRLSSQWVCRHLCGTLIKALYIHTALHTYNCSHLIIFVTIILNLATVIPQSHETVRLGFYDGVYFFRVIVGFVNRFGLFGYPQLQAHYCNDNTCPANELSAPIPSDPIVAGGASNTRLGTC